MTRPRVLIGCAVVTAAAVWFFYPESGALIWHVRHGNTTEFSGLHFHVPLFYSVSAQPERRVLYMVAVPGRARNFFKGGRTLKVSMISLHQSQELPHLEVENVDPWASRVYVKAIDRALSLAGNSGRCIGFTGDAIWNGDKDVEISCEFQGGYQAHFSGTETGAVDFFRIVSTAQEAKGKN